MTKIKTPYTIVYSRYITEKSHMLETLQNSERNKSQRKCKTPKYTFLVNPKSNKIEIAQAIEEIFSSDKIKVTKVNTVYIKPKKKRIRGRIGKTITKKKAIVSLSAGNILNEIA